MLLGAILVPITNLFFVWLAVSEPNLVSLATVISVDNLSGGFATSAFIAYLSSLTNTTYTATQYALFSSLMTLPAKIIGGFSASWWRPPVMRTFSCMPVCWERRRYC